MQKILLSHIVPSTQHTAVVSINYSGRVALLKLVNSLGGVCVSWCRVSPGSSSHNAVICFPSAFILNQFLTTFNAAAN